MIQEPRKPTSLPNLKVIDPEHVRTGEYQAFLKYVAERSGVASYQQLALVWPSLVQGALEWMVVRKKSVDLGFCILHPVPLRANWKHILLAKFPTLGPKIFGKSQRDRDRMLELAGFDTAMFDSKLLALSGDRMVAWDIEVEPKRAWWRAMFKQETHLFNALGSLSYAEYVAKRISDLRLKLLRLYFTFLKKISYPAARVCGSRQGKRTFLAPFIPKGAVRAVGTDDGPVYVVTERAKSGQLARTTIPQFPPITGLPELPGVESGPADLRALGFDVRLPD